MNLSSAVPDSFDDVPSFSTYWDMIEDVDASVSSVCQHPLVHGWSANLLSAWAGLSIIFNLFLLLVVLRFYKKLNNPFYVNVISALCSNLLLLIPELYEPKFAACVMRKTAKRRMAYKVYLTVAIDSMLLNGLALALLRFSVVHYTYSGRPVAGGKIAVYGVLYSWAAAVIFAILLQFGLELHIWYDDEGNYNDVYSFPCYIETGVLVLSICFAALLYFITFIRIVRKRSRNIPNFSPTYELKILAQCIIIFLSGLLFIGGNDWIGNNILPGNVNQVLYFMSKSFIGSVSAVTFLIFSADLRQCCIKLFTCRK